MPHGHLLRALTLLVFVGTSRVGATLVPTPAPALDTLRIRVTDSAGKPLAGATVSVAQVERVRTVDGQGLAEFLEIATGWYTVSIRRAGYQPELRQVSVAGRSEVTVRLQPSALRLEPLTVTATRSSIDPMASPLPSDALSGDLLQRDQQVSLAQTMEGLPGLRSLSTGAQVGKPIIRGLSGPRVLTLDNGLRLEDYSWSDEDGPSVDPLLARRVEVIRGPASVLYGSDAMGGVLNVIPAEVPDARGRAGFVQGSLGFYGGTNNGEIGVPFHLEGASGGFGWRATAIGRRAGNLHTPTGNDSTPSGELYNTGFKALNGELALGLHGSKASGTLRYERYGGDFDLLDGPPVPEDNQLGPLRRLADNRIQLTTNFLLGGTRLETRSQWQNHSLKELVDQSRVGTQEPTFELMLNTFTTDVLLHHASGNRLSGTIGVSGMFQSNESEGQFPLVPGGEAGAGALFAFEQLTEGRWSFLAGLRGDLRHLSTEANAAIQHEASTRNTSAITGNLGGIFRASGSLAVAANLGRAYRDPTLYELYTNGPHLGEDRYEVGLPDAVPETSFNADLSIRWHKGSFAGQVGGYRNQINSYLYVQPTDSMAEAVNEETGETILLPLYRFAQTSRALIWGLDVSAEATVAEPFTVRLRLDYANGTNQATSEPLPLMPPLRADIGGELHTGKLGSMGRSFLSAEVESVWEQTRLGPFDTPTAGYTLLNLGAGIHPAIGGREYAVGLKVQNATNTRYNDFLSRYKTFAYGQGVNAMFRVSVNF